MSRAAFSCLLLALVGIVFAADPKPSRALCDETPFRVPFAQVNADLTSVVALSDDLGPSTVAASYAGTVYIYYRDVQNVTNNGGRSYSLTYGDWTQIQTLVTDNLYETASFGASLALSGDVLAVGQPQWLYRSAFQSEYTGAVYLYRRSGPGANYTLEDVVYYIDSVNQVARDALFGTSISLIKNGTLLLVGSPGCCPPDNIGTAFTYYYGLPLPNATAPEWIQTNGPAQTQVQTLGQSVALADTSPSFVLMGAPGYIAGYATGPGVYTAPVSLTGTVDSTKRSVLPENGLTITPAPDPTTSECGFAMSEVDEKRRRVVWSCPGYNSARGATYSSELIGNQWGTSRRIGSPAPANGARFGQSVAYQDPMLIVTEAGVSGALVHVFQIVPVTLKPEAYLNVQTFTFTNTLPFEQFANLTVSVDFRDNVLAVAAYGELNLYDCPLPSSASAITSAVLLAAAFVALLLAM